MKMYSMRSSTRIDTYRAHAQFKIKIKDVQYLIVYCIVHNNAVQISEYKRRVDAKAFHGDKNKTLKTEIESVSSAYDV